MKHDSDMHPGLKILKVLFQIAAGLLGTFLLFTFFMMSMMMEGRKRLRALSACFPVFGC